MSERKAVIKNADMNQELQEDAVDVAARVIACLERRDVTVQLRVLAAYIKKEFDQKYSPTWHCIVGRNFGGC